MKAAQATPGPGADSAGDPYLPEQGNGGYRVVRYDLELDYKVTGNRLAGKARITAEALAPLTRLSFDLAHLRVAKVTVDGRRPAKFAQRGRKVQVGFVKPVPTGARFVVEIQYGGTPRPVRGRWGDVGWEELEEGVIVASQPDGAASWFPCNDHPSEKSAYRISITTDSPYRAVANGTLVDRRVRSSRTTWVYDQTDPMASYLATVQIGRYQSYDIAKGPVRQQAVLPAHLRRRFVSDFGRQTQMMTTFRDLFGPYPFAAYTVVVTADELEIPVEAQGISIFGANHLDGVRGSERLVAHELAHQWFGNSLTIRRWQDIWLHEGFACYAEWLWSEKSGGPAAEKHAQQWWGRLAGQPQDIVIADPGPDLMFDDRLYKRGALTLHALRLTLGDEAFFSMLRKWAKTNRHGSVSTAEFAGFVGRYSERVPRLLTAWLHKPSLPQLPPAR